MKKFIHLFWNSDGMPQGVRVLTAVTSIRWIGWGFAESLVPVFLYSFGNSYAEAGMLQSIYTVALVLALPVLGIMADRIRASTLVLVSLVAYLFIGASYLLAGLTGVVIFAMVARLLNGVAYGMDTIGRDTYFRRNVQHNKVATAFGYQDSITNFWWIVAALAGIGLVQFFSIPTLLFMITPTALIAIIVLMRFRKKDTSEVRHANTTQLQKADPLAVHPPMRLSWALRGVVATYFFISFASSVISFFVPIQAYTEGTNLGLIIIMGVVVTLPALLGLGLGKLFDHKGHKAFAYGIALFALLIVALAFLHTYVWQLIILFLVAIVQEFLSVGYQELVTVHAIPEHYGRTSGILRSITNIGALAGPFAVGFIMDSAGTQTAYLLLAAIIACLAGMFWFIQSRTGKVVDKVLEQA